MARDACAVIGSGGHSRVVIAALRASGIRVTALYDERPERHGETVDGAVVSGDCAAGLNTTMPAHLAIGDNGVRRDLAATKPPGGWMQAVHPSALVDPAARIGAGSLVALGAIVQAGASVGAHVIVNTGAIVEHDCVVGDFAHVAPGSVLGGGVQVGQGVLIGLGARVLPGVRIGDWAVIGAGAVVMKDVADGQTVAGVPARPTR